MKTRRVKTRGGRECYATKKAHETQGGPFPGHKIYLSSDGDGCTGLLQVRDQIGRYRHGCWQPMSA